jgi:hypothetical protein
MCLSHQLFADDMMGPSVSGQTAGFNPYQQIGYQQVQPEYSGVVQAYCPPEQYGEEGTSEYTPLNFRRRQVGYESGETPYDAYLKNVFKQVWWRVDYLNWGIKGPGSNYVGESVPGVEKPDDPFLQPFGPEGFSLVKVPSLDQTQLPNNNGIRVAAGLPTTFGEIEGSMFVLSQAEEEVNYDNFINQNSNILNGLFPTYIGINTNFNGEKALNIFPFDRSYMYRYTSQVFGSDLNIHWDLRKTDLGFNHDVLVGAKFLNVSERFYQKGTADESGAVILYTEEIDSSSRNLIVGPQVGMRTEFKHQWFVLGVENKVMLGMNNIQNNIKHASFNAVNNFGVTDQTQNTQNFAAAYDLHTYAKAKIGHNFWLNVGFNFMGVTGVSRPDDNITYDDDDLLFPMLIGMDSKLQTYFVQGISIGGEYRFY